MRQQMKDMANRLLDRSTEFTGVDTRYLTKSGSWVVLTRVSYIFSGFVLSIAFANLLSPTVFGTYQFIISVVSIAGAITLTGLQTVVMQETGRGGTGMLQWGFRKRLLWSLIPSSILVLGALYYFINENMTLSGGLLIAAVFTPFFESFKMYRALLIGKQNFKLNAALSITFQIIPLLAIVGVLFVTDNVLWVLFTYFGANTLVLSILYTITQRVYPEESTEVANRHLSYGKHLSLMDMIGQIAGNVDKILIFHFLGAAPVAMYHLAVAPVKHLRGLNKIIETLVSPRFPNRSVHELRSTLPKKALYFLVLSSGLAIAYMLAAPFFFNIFFPQYLDAIVYSQVYALILITMPVILFAQTFVAHEKKKELYIIKVVTPLLRVILFVVLIPLYGVWGVVLALIGSKFLNALFITVMFFSLKQDHNQKQG